MASQHGTAIRVVLAGRPELVSVLKAALGAAGIRVVASCADRAQTLAALAQSAADVCIVDRELAGGGLIAAAAAASPRAAPKVLVIGDGEAPAEQRAATLAGAAAYLPSSIDAASLVAAVSQLANDPRTRR
jgi:DNA-binding NarL/FixJ family response regulator